MSRIILKPQPRRYRQLPEYRIWYNMQVRCYNERCAAYLHYGARGIEVHHPWRLNFYEFYKYMGPRPSPVHSIDRFPRFWDDYKPGNVRWATSKQQAANKRNSQYFEMDGVKVFTAQLAHEHNMRPSTLVTRLKNGWPLEKALTTPVRHQTWRVPRSSEQAPPISMRELAEMVGGRYTPPKKWG